MVCTCVRVNPDTSVVYLSQAGAFSRVVICLLLSSCLFPLEVHQEEQQARREMCASSLKNGIWTDTASATFASLLHQHALDTKTSVLTRNVREELATILNKMSEQCPDAFTEENLGKRKEILLAWLPMFKYLALQEWLDPDNYYSIKPECVAIVEKSWDEYMPLLCKTKCYRIKFRSRCLKSLRGNVDLRYMWLRDIVLDPTRPWRGLEPLGVDTRSSVQGLIDPQGLDQTFQGEGIRVKRPLPDAADAGHQVVLKRSKTNVPSEIDWRDQYFKDKRVQDLRTLYRDLSRLVDSDLLEEDILTQMVQFDDDELLRLFGAFLKVENVRTRAKLIQKRMDGINVQTGNTIGS